MVELDSNRASLERYYQLHAGIYDASRWAFLFGRDRLVQLVREKIQPQRILEVGCGTGKNLNALATVFPEAQLVGVDLSGEMLAQAKKRLQRFGDRIVLEQRAYGDSTLAGEGFDLIVFAYSLSMMNPGWDSAIETAATEVRDGGVLAVVDFFSSPVTLFKRWMAVNHVAMEGHLVKKLDQHFGREVVDINWAYLGLWQYVLYVGQKSATSDPVNRSSVVSEFSRLSQKATLVH